MWRTAQIGKTVTASPFYRHKEGRCTCTGERRSRRSSPNRGRVVAEYCRKYTVPHWRVRRRARSHPGCRPWPCGDRAGVPVAPAGGVVVAVAGTSFRCGVAAFRGSCWSGSRSDQGSGRARGSCPCRLRVLWRGKYEGSTRSWQRSGRNSAAHVRTVHRRFPQWCHCARNGCAVTRVGG